MVIRPYADQDLDTMIMLWNEVVEAGNAFPQTEPLTRDTAETFFAEQSLSAVADDGQVVGLYILHPNNVGRCGHIANASFAVDQKLRGHGIGRQLVSDALRRLKDYGFRGLQFNAVVKSNETALKLYKDLGFTSIGVIPGGFRNKENIYEDIYIFYHEAPEA